MPRRGAPFVVLPTLLLLTVATGLPVAPVCLAAPGGISVADQPIAAAAGAEILARGGNAVDAAVAVSFTLSVVRPQSCGIGGGGFLVIHLADDGTGEPATLALDYRERAPLAVAPDHFETLDDPEASTYGVHAVATPGTVAGLLFALERYGTLDRGAVLAPAIRAAEEGFVVDAHYLGAAEEAAAWVRADPGRPQRRAFLWERILRRGTVALGDTIRLPEQAEALRLISRDGADAFYRGPIAEAILRAVRSEGGILARADLEAFRPKVVAPLEGSFRGRRVVSMPSPSSGGAAVLQILGFLERVERRHGPPLERLVPGDPAFVHLLVEAMKHAFADRARYMADDEFAPVPFDALLDPENLDRVAERFDPVRTFPADAYGTRPAGGIGLEGAVPSDGGTSAFCVMDDRGNAVSGTETINLYFGSRVAVEPYGFFLNDEMDDFTTVRGEANAYGLSQSDRNLPAPGKRPLSSMSPVIVFDGRGEVELLAGGSGGPRIISGVVQAVLWNLVWSASPQEAVARPRVHHQWSPDAVRFEKPGADSPGMTLTVDALQRRGHAVEFIPSAGIVQCARRGPAGFTGGADPRKGGAAVTPSAYTAPR